MYATVPGWKCSQRKDLVSWTLDIRQWPLSPFAKVVNDGAKLTLGVESIAIYGTQLAEFVQQ